MESKRNIPFRAALFDLDGTLLDSMYVWEEVDRRFFQLKQLQMPEDYPRALSGLSYRQSAEYTKQRFGFPEPWEDIVAVWTEMSRDEYHNRVPLKPGSLEYLQFLKQSGIKLAVTTSLLPELYEGCLKRLGIYDMFDAFCSTREKSKEDGGIFLRAAEKLGMQPQQCAVFEDVYEGIAGAKRVGMQAYCVMDKTASHAHGQIAQIADGMLENILQMRRVHSMPGRCVIFSAVCEDPSNAYSPQEQDMVLCADAGYKIAAGLGVQPHLVIGDFDSAPAPLHLRTERHPVEKDDTDTMLCVRHAIGLGYDHILIVGGLGGRFGHSMANVQTLLFAARNGVNAVLDDGRTRMRILENGSVCLNSNHTTLSVFSLSPESTGVTLRGLKYCLENGVVTAHFPIGCSNSFGEGEAFISVENGTLLLVEED